MVKNNVIILTIPLVFVSSSTYNFAWDARQLEYTCNGLKEQTGKDWFVNGDFCVHFSTDRYSWSDATKTCGEPSYSSSTALTSLSWMELRLLPESDQRYWTALRLKDADTLIDGPVSTSICNPAWADSEPTSFEDACVAINLPSLSSKLRGWHFEDCSMELPVICQTFACIGDEFRCSDNTRCISRTAVNDGFEDCIDGSDESGVAAQLKLDDADTNINNASQPHPEELYCPLPQELHEVQVVQNSGFEVGEIIKWKCNSGFSPLGKQESVCTKNTTWEPSIKCEKLSCDAPDPMNLTHVSGTFHGDRAIYATYASKVNSELTRLTVCDEGTWVSMNDELNNICVAAPFKFGHFAKDRFALGEIMQVSCAQDFYSDYSANVDPTCQGIYDIPVCNPDSIIENDCDGTMNVGSPLFGRDWCTCTDGGICKGGDCEGFIASCSAENDTCSGGRECQRNITDRETFYCTCPSGTCLYPFDDCDQKAFLQMDTFDKSMGECASIRCPIDVLVALVPSNCRITAYENAENYVEIDMRLGTTDVICSHNRTSLNFPTMIPLRKQYQTRHAVKCVDGKWEGAEFNKVCKPTSLLVFSKEEYGAYEFAKVFYPAFPEHVMYIECNGNGEWLGEVPTEKCINGSFQPDMGLVRCICNEGFYGEDCSSPCDHGITNADGSCECSPDFHGDHCEISEICDDKPMLSTNGEQIDLVFLIDMNGEGFDYLLGDEKTGLIPNIQQLIRDISYYDGNFVRNIILYPFGTGSTDIDIPFPTYSFPWSEVGTFVEKLYELYETQGIHRDNMCRCPIKDVWKRFSSEYTLPFGSIVNIFTVKSLNTDDYSMVDGWFDPFLSGGFIVNVITDGSVQLTACKDERTTDYSNYLRFTSLTGGYLLDGISAASFLHMLPRFYKSSTVLIPANPFLDEPDDVLPFPIVLDDQAQSIIIYSYLDNGYLYPIPEQFNITKSSDPATFNIEETNTNFQVLHNNRDEEWHSIPTMEGYLYQSAGKLNWQEAMDACEAMGGTVADFLPDNICPEEYTSYWMPIRLDPDYPPYEQKWVAFYRGTKIPVKFTRFDEATFDFECAGIAFWLNGNTWFSSDCENKLNVMCQRSVFNTQKTTNLKTDDISSFSKFTFNLFTREVEFSGAFFSVRVQSNLVFGFDMNDNELKRITSGTTRLRIASMSGLVGSDSWPTYVSVMDGISRSRMQQTACTHYSRWTEPLFCTTPNDLIVQVSNRHGPVRSFITRCDYTDYPEFYPPPDCTSSGVIAENTAYCYTDSNELGLYSKGSCRKGFGGDFCEESPTTEESCTHYNLLNDVSIDSNVMKNGCGCTNSMDNCSFNRHDPCDNRCSSNSTCQFITKGEQRAVASCVCDAGYTGEFCDRKQDCSGKPCHNGATCEDLIEQIGFRCFCDTDYTGEVCEIPLGMCSESVCQNGGTCYNIDPISTFCLCAEGYTGDRCERMLNLGCFNGGIQIWDGSCECSLPWEGRYCTLLKDPMPLEVCSCSGGATCVFDVQAGIVQTSCVCPDNIVGEFCETQQLPCDDYCWNGGECLELEGKPVCQCPLKFAGKHCEKAVTNKSYNIMISPSTQLLTFSIDINPVFSVCLWIKATPKRTIQNPEMPIFEMEFGGEKLRVSTSMVIIQGQPVHALNLRMQLWQQFCIRCSDAKCDAFVNGASQAINLIGTFSHSSATLVIAPALENDEVMLDAEISRLSIYDRAIADKEAAEFAFECASAYGKDQMADDLWWNILDSAPRSALISPGLCESSTCWPGLCEEKIDKSLPIATFCPPDIFLDSSQPISIEWTEPVFEDNQALLSISSNYRSGDIFAWGEHHVVYTATDASNNTGRCEFEIYLASNTCTKPQNPYKGDLFYKDTFDGESGSFSMASVRCEDERFPQDGPMFYVCDYMGQWRRSYYSPEVNLPSCGKVTEPEEPTNGTVYECPTEAPFQFEKHGAILCAEVPPGFYYNRKVQARFICPIDQYQDQSNQPKCEHCPNGTITVSEGATKRSDCYQNCAPGSWCNYDTGLGDDGTVDHCCQRCEKGRFAPENGTLQCLYCKDGMTTQNEGTINENDCYWPCTVGQEVDDVTRECRDCERGMYKDSDQAGQCSKCVDGLTTIAVGSQSSYDCSVLYCLPNTYVNPNAKYLIDPETFNIDDFCLPCEKGTMQSQPNSTSCVKCPDTPDLNNELPSTCRIQNECSPLLPNYCGDEMKCLKWDDYNYYHCVEDLSEQHNDGEFLLWWQIVLIAAGCVALATVVVVSVIIGMRYFNDKNTANAATETLSEERRTTNDNFVGTVPDSDASSDRTPAIETPQNPIEMQNNFIPSTSVGEKLPNDRIRPVTTDIVDALIFALDEDQFSVESDSNLSHD